MPQQNMEPAELRVNFSQLSFSIDALEQDIDIFTLHSSDKSSQVTPAMQPDLAAEDFFRNPSGRNPWLKFQESLIKDSSCTCLVMEEN